MSKRESFLRYSAIISKVRNARDATFEEISDYLQSQSELSGYNLTISKRTFQRDLDEIRSIFDIDIQYNFKRKVYSEVGDTIQTGKSERMLEAFNMFNTLNVAGGLSRYIFLEKRKPQGTEHIYILLHAIQSHSITRFKHQKYWDDGFTSRSVEPYGLKEFKDRWYLLAKDHKDGKIKSFGLDRIQNIEITKEKFPHPKDFDAEGMFRYCFGIVTAPGEKPEDIVLSFDPEQGKYIKSFPLHETQVIIIDAEDELRIKLTLYITHDLIMELLSYGETVKVISPVKLKRDLLTRYRKALEQ